MIIIAERFIKKIMSNSLYNRSNSCWITWHFSTRSRNLAETLSVPLYELSIENNIIWRHLGSSLWTIWILLKTRPKIIYLQNSFLLLFIVVLYKWLRFNKVMIICDCHTKSLRRVALGMFNYIFWPIKQICFKCVNLTIISNKDLIKDIIKLNSNFFILPDKIPSLKFIEDNAKDGKYCVYISSFAVDEPFNELFDVARILGNEIKLFWTGKAPNGINVLLNKPSNLLFTGYLNDETYLKLIGNADCVLALTTEGECLQCGAFEALSLSVPMVLTDTYQLKQYFGSAAVYTNHSPENIAKSITYAIDNKYRLKKEIDRIKDIKKVEFMNLLNNLKLCIEREIEVYS